MPDCPNRGLSTLSVPPWGIAILKLQERRNLPHTPRQKPPQDDPSQTPRFDEYRFQLRLTLRSYCDSYLFLYLPFAFVVPVVVSAKIFPTSHFLLLYTFRFIDIRCGSFLKREVFRIKTREFALPHSTRPSMLAISHWRYNNSAIQFPSSTSGAIQMSLFRNKKASSSTFTSLRDAVNAIHVFADRANCR